MVDDLEDLLAHTVEIAHDFIVRETEYLNIITQEQCVAFAIMRTGGV